MIYRLGPITLALLLPLCLSPLPFAAGFLPERRHLQLWSTITRHTPQVSSSSLLLASLSSSMYEADDASSSPSTDAATASTDQQPPPQQRTRRT
eukprot:scaffold3524_cov122-Amphora_coffeaeformis.AAC.1